MRYINLRLTYLLTYYGSCWQHSALHNPAVNEWLPSAARQELSCKPTMNLTSYHCKTRLQTDKYTQKQRKIKQQTGCRPTHASNPPLRSSCWSLRSTQHSMVLSRYFYFNPLSPYCCIMVCCSAVLMCP